MLARYLNSVLAAQTRPLSAQLQQAAELMCKKVSHLYKKRINHQANTQKAMLQPCVAARHPRTVILASVFLDPSHRVGALFCAAGSTSKHIAVPGTKKTPVSGVNMVRELCQFPDLLCDIALKLSPH